jgi:hypothetical protein
VADRFVHGLLKSSLSVPEARGLYTDLALFLSVQDPPVKPLSGRESWGGDSGLSKKGRFRKT